MRASYKENDGDALLQDFHSILNKSIERFKETTNDSMLYFKSFTDNVLLAHPRFSKDMEAEFGFILWSILEYQFEMALKGFFIRGGLSVGPLFVARLCLRHTIWKARLQPTPLSCCPTPR
jgi:hypothetical protein